MQSSPAQYAKVAEEVLEYAALSPAKLVKKVKQLEQQMYEHARNLEFEEAAKIRDQIHKIKEQNLGLSDIGVV